MLLFNIIGILSLLLLNAVLYKIVPSVVHRAQDDGGKEDDCADDNRGGDCQKVQLGLANFSSNALQRIDDAEFCYLTWHSCDRREQNVLRENEDKIRVLGLASSQLHCVIRIWTTMNRLVNYDNPVHFIQ